MRRLISVFIPMLLVLALAGCTTLGGSLDTADKQALAFCRSFNSTLGKLTLMMSVEKLTPSQAEIVDTVVLTIGPICLQEMPADPTMAMLNSLDLLIAIQLLKE